MMKDIILLRLLNSREVTINTNVYLSCLPARVQCEDPQTVLQINHMTVPEKAPHVPKYIDL